MGFLRSDIKKLARTKTRNELRMGYERTENKLTRAAQTGDRKAYNAAMKEHQRYEGAIYEQITADAKARRSKKSK